MENPLINPHDFSLNNNNNHHSSSPLANGSIFNQYHHHAIEDEDIEMFAYRSMSYTSLKDMMSSSPPSTCSPTNSRKDSWREIPIKDPLLQHAAWAYLQPIEVARDEDRRWWMILGEKCGGVFGCLNDVVLAVFGWFSEQTSEDRVD